MKKMSKFLSGALVAMLALGMTACGGSNQSETPGDPTPDPTPVVPTGPAMKCFDDIINAAAGGTTPIDVTLDTTLAAAEDHSEDEYYTKYSAVMGDYYKYLVAAKAQEDVDAKWVGMAIAEAKLLQTGTFLPTSSQGGRYAISKVAYGTVSPTLWGLDSDRMHNAVVATTYIKEEDRDALKVKYKELKGTGTYEAYAKKYLTDKGYTLKDEYTMAYSSDPRTWDITNTYRAADSEAIVNTYDGLIEYDNEGRMMSALATDLKISADGLKYTFTIRDGVYWVDKDGRKYAEITAQDWVDGMESVLTNDMTAYLVDGIIEGASAYIAGETTDFTTVGVKATGKYTLEYTLEAPCSYFVSMFNYNPFAPLCKAYVDATEGYGTAPDKILYCGPYIVTNYTKDNKIVYEANPEYWNKDAINLKKITWISYNGNEDVTATYKDMKAGTIDGCGLNNSTIELAKTDGLFNDYVYVSGTDATTYGFFYNLDRQSFTTEGYPDTESTQTADQKTATKAAMNNINFRMAIARGLDRAAYNALSTGEDCKLYSLQNEYVPGNFVKLNRDVTVSINGTPTTFAKGTYYGAIVQAQLNADMGENAMKVWDPTLEAGAGSSSGFDGWYNANLAKEYLATAISELAAQGITVDADHPICLDYPVWGEYAIYANRAQAIKQALNTLFEGKVQLNIVSTSQYGWYYVGYYCDYGSECNYDLYDCSGWGPDYGDPATYLNTMLPVDGDMIHMLGWY